MIYNLSNSDTIGVIGLIISVVGLIINSILAIWIVKILQNNLANKRY